MKIAIAQINPTIGAFKHNAHKIVAQAEKARHQGCELVIFSELAIPGYPPRDLLDKPQFIAAGRACLERLVEEIDGIGVILGGVTDNPRPGGKPLFNEAVLFEDGRILQRVYKQLLPTYDVFDERRHFEPGPPSAPFSYKGHRLGLTICEDLWNDKDIFSKPIYSIDPAADLVAKGADLLINISASVYHGGKNEFRTRMFASMARKYRLPIVYANQVGGNDSVLYDGVSAVYAADGRQVARARDFEEDLIIWDSAGSDGYIHPISADANTSIYKALVTGTRDYLGKCGFTKAVVGLSGGIDSALVACVAADALGPENVTTLFMPSPYTSRDNFEDTRRLADNLGVTYSILPIDRIYEGFLAHLTPGFGNGEPGITEQNIQARIRGTILMAHSNRTGSLVLSTGNKSELAVGYCTLYGDMCGGLAVIADVPKTRAYALARHLNAGGERIPERIIAKPPSAELKPDQTDQDDLPPYEVIDPIIQGYVEESKGLETLVKEGFDRQVVSEVINRIDRNEYKRFQAPPGIKITPKAFGEGRRYPLAKRFELD
jgi:NAD+ synthase (glutamine-hydrolysing)